MAMAKQFSDHKINTALSYVNAPIADLSKLKTLLDKSAVDHLYNLTVVDSNASNILEQISTQLTTKQLDIDSELQNLLSQYNMKYQELMQLINSMSAYSNFDSTTGSCNFTWTQYTNNNNKYTPEYTQYTTNIWRINTLISELISINWKFYNGQIDSTNVSNNVWSKLDEYSKALNKIQNRQIEWMNIVNQTKNFDHNRDMILEKWNTFDTSVYLFQMWQIPQWNLTYSFENAQPYTVQVDRWWPNRQPEQCMPVIIKESDGKTKQVQVKATDCIINWQDGTVTVSNKPELFDINGVLYKPKQDYEFDLSVAIDRDTWIQQQTNATNLILHSSKKLLIKRVVSSLDKDSILKNPAFTIELTNRMSVAHRQHILAIDNKDSQIYQSIRTHLEKHPDFATLSEHQKEELYHRVLWIHQVDATNPTAPVLWPLLSASISPTQARDTTVRPPATTLSMSNHSLLFSEYVQTDKVEPKPTPEDTKNEGSYRNWLSRNLTALTKNYIAHRLSSYINDTHVTQAVNDAITQYVTDRDTRQLNGVTHLVPNINAAARALRACQPRKTKGTSWTRLLTGKWAEISDKITKPDGGEMSYKTILNVNNMPAVSATITVDGQDPVTYHGATPGDLLAKLLTWWGARIDGHQARLHVAFGTMKALIKTTMQAGVTMVVPINQTNGDELRVSLDSNDKLKVERYNFDTSIDDFVLSTAPWDSFDEDNVEHKSQMTHNFLVRMNQVTNIVMDRQYAGFQDTMSDASSNIKNLWRWALGDRERMSYKANPRWLRWLLTKRINRKQPGVESFAFPVTVGDKTLNVTYDPNGTISLEWSDGKTRKGTNLAKLLNPHLWIFNKKKNFTDGFEMPIMQWLYDGLSRQLIQNERVNEYTYLVRDPVTKIMYTMYQWADGDPKIGVIENVSQNIWTIDRTRDMLLMDRQKRWRTKWVPPQAIRELNDQEKTAVMGRPEIMDWFMQNMLKAREEILHIPVGWYRGLSLNATNLWRAATIGWAVAAIGGIDLMSGGLLSSSAYTAGLETSKFVTGTAPNTMWTVTKNAAHGLWEALWAWGKVITAPFKWAFAPAA